MRASSPKSIVSQLAINPTLENDFRNLINALTRLRLEDGDGNLSGFFVEKKETKGEEKDEKRTGIGIEAYSVQRPGQSVFEVLVIYGTLKQNRIEEVGGGLAKKRYAVKNACTSTKNDFFRLLKNFNALHISKGNENVIFISDPIAFTINLVKILTDINLHPYFNIPLPIRIMYKEKLEIQFTAIIDALKTLIINPLLPLDSGVRSSLNERLNEIMEEFKKQIVVKPDFLDEKKTKSDVVEFTFPGWAELILFKSGIRSDGAYDGDSFLPDYMSILNLTELNDENLQQAFDKVKKSNLRNIQALLFCLLSHLACGGEDKAVNLIIESFEEFTKFVKKILPSRDYIELILRALVEDNCFVNPANKVKIAEKFSKKPASTLQISSDLSIELKISPVVTTPPVPTTPSGSSNSLTYTLPNAPGGPPPQPSVPGGPR